MTPFSPLRGARRRVGAAALALSLLALSGATPASAATGPAPMPGDIVADSGFRPAVDGYGFANYGNSEGYANLNARSLRRLFGDSVCSSLRGALCTLTPAAQTWMEQENSAMQGGHCFGFATTSQFFFRGLGSPATPRPFGSPFIGELEIDANTRLQRHIATAWSYQSLKNVQATYVGRDPSQTIHSLRTTLRPGRNPRLLVIEDQGDGHAITPYALNRLGLNRWQILVYDNNWPGQKRAVNVNTKRETWSYVIEQGTIWRGDGTSETLLSADPRAALGRDNPCPFCSEDPQASSSPAGEEEFELRLAGTAPGSALPDLNVSAGAGSAGLDADGSYNSIDGATSRLPLTGADPRDLTAAPVFTLPGGSVYELSLSQRLGAPTQPERIDAIGAGWTLGAELESGAGETDGLSLEPSERAITYRADQADADEPVALEAGTDGADLDLALELDTELPAGAEIRLAIDPATRTAEVSVEGTDSQAAELRITKTPPSGPVERDSRALELSDGESFSLSY